MNLKKIWKFLWYDDSPLSWIVSIILAFIIIKFIVYPLIGILLGTGYPIVAVVSGSMEHNADFDTWWEFKGEWYEEENITKEQFSKFKFKNGFNKGDIMIVLGKEPQNINKGDVLIFESTVDYPVIHRIVKIWQIDEKYYFQTKGDNNMNSYDRLNEKEINEENIVGVAVLRVPYLGWIKIVFSKILGVL
jgi:signal peptidase I